MGLLSLIRKFFLHPSSAEEQVAAVSQTVKPQQVGKFYDTYNDKFVQVYGEIIQAYRTTDVTKLLDYEAVSMGLAEGMKVCDAGCGVAGPAIYFATKYGVQVEGVTVSEVQCNAANKKIESARIADKVKVSKQDYHELPSHFGKEVFDVVYFLESFGHSHDHAKAIQSVWEVLKPGGTLYIKDLFRKLAFYPEHQAKIDYEIGRINEAYRYNVAELNTVLNALRVQGFAIMFVKTIDLKLEEFENLTVSNDFQELTGIAKIENWEEYIFPVDFFEIKCYKPVYDLLYGTDKYFLQNLYWMQVHKKQQQELDYGKL
ncbi:MAG: class I SAM-dependent methyltransferase [Chitinophagales bacterium]